MSPPPTPHLSSNSRPPLIHRDPPASYPTSLSLNRQQTRATQEHLDRFPKHAEAWAYKARADAAHKGQRKSRAGTGRSVDLRGWRSRDVRPSQRARLVARPRAAEETSNPSFEANSSPSFELGLDPPCRPGAPRSPRPRPQTTPYTTLRIVNLFSFTLVFEFLYRFYVFQH